MRFPIIFSLVFMALSFVLRTAPAVIAADYILPVFGNANMDKTIDEGAFEIKYNMVT